MSSLNSQKSRDSTDNKLTVTEEAYAKDSFDRFGDDLSELILSFLPLKDKYRYECVKFQWKRLIYNKVSHFDHNSFWPNPTVIYESFEDDIILYSISKNVTEQQLKTALQKCHNVTTISFGLSPETISSLSLLLDNFHKLESVNLFAYGDFYTEEFTSFFKKFGSKIKGFVQTCYTRCTMFVSFCPNLKRLKFQDPSDWLCLVGNGLVPTLNHLEEVWVERHQIPDFIQLVDKYENSLKSFEIIFYETACLAENVGLIFQRLYRLKNIESISVGVSFNDDDYEEELPIDITPIMVKFNQKCSNLSIIKLKIIDVILSRPSKPMKNLKKLCIECNYMSDDFFVYISELTPNIKEFSFSSDMIYTNEHLNCLSRLKHIKKLSLSADNRPDIIPIDDSAVIQLFDSCKQIIDLEFVFFSNITVKTIDKLKEVSNNRPKDKIKFSTKSSDNEFLSFCQPMAEIPGNLSLIVIQH